MKRFIVMIMIFLTAVLINLSPALAIDTVFQETFESSWGNWWADGGLWEVGAPSAGPANSYDGASCAGTVLGGNYAENTDSRLISPSIVLPAVTGDEALHLRFWHWFSYSSYDAGYVQISAYDDASGTWSDWQTIGNSMVNTSSVWSVADIDLTSYAAKKIRVGFYHTAKKQYYSSISTGWYVDGVQVVKKIPEFTGGFESGWGDWSADRGLWEVGPPTAGPTKSYDGASCAGTVLGGNYTEHTDSRLISPPVTLSTTGNQEIHLRFWHWFSYSSYDAGYVQISVHDDASGTWADWQTIGNSFVSSSSVWTIMDVDLTSYADKKIKIAFYHTAKKQYYSSVSTGWYIDDVQFTGIQQTPVNKTWYYDADGDGYGDPDETISSSSQPAGYVADGSDCDDTDATVHPAATEIPGDGIDQDCDGTDLTSSDKWYSDSDGDGYGDPNNSLTSSSQPVGYVSTNTDCDDSDNSIHPGAAEIDGDGVDQNCDGNDNSSTTPATVDQISLLSPVNNETMSYGVANNQVTFSFTKLTDVVKYILHLELTDILNYLTIGIPVELIPPANSSSSPFIDPTAATPGFSETFIGMVYNLTLDSTTWDILALYNIKWGVEAYNDNGELIGSSFDGSQADKYVNAVKLVASNAIVLTSPTLGEELNQTNSALSFQWETYSGVGTYTLILAHVGSLGFENVITQENLTLNIFPMDDPTWQSMPTGDWYWTVLGFDSFGSQMPSDFTIFDFEVNN